MEEIGGIWMGRLLGQGENCRARGLGDGLVRLEREGVALGNQIGRAHV